MKYEDAGDNRGRNARRCHMIRTLFESKNPGDETIALIYHPDPSESRVA
jgi:hypothetical protein